MPDRRSGREREAEPDEAFLARLRRAYADTVFNGVRPKDVRRALDLVWSEPQDVDMAVAALSRAVDQARLTTDRRIVEAYIRRYPRDHPAFGLLAQAAAKAADRRDWVHRDSGRRWGIFDGDRGAQRLAQAALAGEPSAVLDAAGLRPESLHTGRFSEAVWRAACDHVALVRPSDAPRAVSALLDLAETLPAFPATSAAFVRALMRPFPTPDAAAKRLVGAALVAYIGDPRTQRSRWAGVRAQLEADYPGEGAGGHVERLRSWLTEAAVHEFLNVVDADADPLQWPYRKAFWLSFLEAGHISDAWVAFGPDAAVRAKQLSERPIRAEDRLYATLSGGYQPSQSVLLMRIGSVTVGDWSHTGRCRFWRRESAAGGRLRDENGGWRRSYTAAELRRLDQSDRELPHGGAASYTWQRNFNELLEELTAGQVGFDYDVRSPTEHNRLWNPRARRR